METLSILLAGLAGVVAMSAFLFGLAAIGLESVVSARIVGALFFKEKKNKTALGWALHFALGIFFALIYALLIKWLPISSGEPVIFFSSAIGFGHGLVVALLLTIGVSEHHPIRQYRKFGPGVAVAEGLAHMVFGLIVGSVLVWMGFDFNLPPS